MLGQALGHWSLGRGVGAPEERVWLWLVQLLPVLADHPLLGIVGRVAVASPGLRVRRHRHLELHINRGDRQSAGTFGESLVKES
jgi:hypothetical protein